MEAERAKQVEAAAVQRKKEAAAALLKSVSTTGHSPCLQSYICLDLNLIGLPYWERVRFDCDLRSEGDDGECVAGKTNFMEHCDLSVSLPILRTSYRWQPQMRNFWSARRWKRLSKQLKTR